MQLLQMGTLPLLSFLHHFIYVIGGGGGGAAAAVHNDTTGNDDAWSSAMQNARIPTKEELKRYMVMYKTMSCNRPG